MNTILGLTVVSGLAGDAPGLVTVSGAAIMDALSAPLHPEGEGKARGTSVRLAYDAHHHRVMEGDLRTSQVLWIDVSGPDTPGRHLREPRPPDPAIEQLTPRLYAALILWRAAWSHRATPTATDEGIGVLALRQAAWDVTFRAGDDSEARITAGWEWPG